MISAGIHIMLLAEEISNERAMEVGQFLVDARRCRNADVRCRLTALIRVVTQYKTQQKARHHLQTTQINRY